ncbi:hypothetical protein [Roseibium sp. RKSG952]|uniref:hypothetical protein n=1 Tax=Roseibium sp. RKSG952 TaxID=2529384 RepID=UPI0012BD4CB4|nr:hypothetical protein [Roseibium sp. RKSG952]MTH96676.1 hypothetical protein [Roseibium sp. RKSG952]
MFRSTITLLCMLPILFASVPLRAETTGWMTKREYGKYTRQLKKQKLIPTKIECRAGKNGNPYEVRLTAKPNTQNKPWEVSVYRASISPKVYGSIPRTSYDAFQSKSGAWYHCMID